MAGWGNSFSLLDEDESGEGIVRVPVKAATPVVAKPAKEEPKTAHKNAAVTDNKESGRKPERQQRAPRAREERGGRSDESAEQQQQQQGGAASGANNERAFARTRGPSDRSSGERRERRDTGASGAPGAARAPRQFDRRSGTGRGREVQRGGAGRGNWGSDEQEIQEQVKAADPGDASVTGGDNAAFGTHDADWAAKNDDAWGSPATAAADQPDQQQQQAKEEKAPRELSEEEKARAAEREAEAKLMTLDEYLEKKKKLDYQLPAPRQAGEGEDSKQWAGFVAAKSDKTADAESSPATKKNEENKSKVKESKKVPLPAELLRFKGEQQRRDNERRERGPRDGGFERRERRDDQPRAPRANNQQKSAPSSKQAEFGAGDFPSLKA